MTPPVELSSEMIWRTGSLRTMVSPLGEMASTVPGDEGSVRVMLSVFTAFTTISAVELPM